MKTKIYLFLILFAGLSACKKDEPVQSTGTALIYSSVNSYWAVYNGADLLGSAYYSQTSPACDDNSYLIIKKEPGTYVVTFICKDPNNWGLTQQRDITIEKNDCKTYDFVP